jgi:hypothetical protein
VSLPSAANFLTTGTLSGCALNSSKSFLMDSVTENNATEIRHYIQAGLWNNTAAINRIDIYRATIAGSTYSLYGIIKGSDGIVTVS